MNVLLKLLKGKLRGDAIMFPVYCTKVLMSTMLSRHRPWKLALVIYMPLPNRSQFYVMCFLRGQFCIS